MDETGTETVNTGPRIILKCHKVKKYQKVKPHQA